MKKAIQKPTMRLLNTKGSISIPCAGAACDFPVSPGTHAYILLNKEGKIMLVWHPACYKAMPSKTEWMRQIFKIVDSVPDWQRESMAITYDIMMSDDRYRTQGRLDFSAFLHAIREKESESVE